MYLLSCKGGVVGAHEEQVGGDPCIPSHLLHEPIEPAFWVTLGEQNGPEGEEQQQAAQRAHEKERDGVRKHQLESAEKTAEQQFLA